MEGKSSEEQIEALEQHFKSVDLQQVTSLKHHAHSWSIGANRWLASNILPKMSSLEKIDLSNTADETNKQDMFMSI